MTDKYDNANTYDVKIGIKLDTSPYADDCDFTEFHIGTDLPISESKKRAWYLKLGEELKECIESNLEDILEGEWEVRRERRENKE